MYRYLAAHPEIATSGEKEMHYFLGGDYKRDSYEAGDSCAYTNEFFDGENICARYTLEASPGYMVPEYSERVAKRIRMTCDDPVLLFLLRDPTERFISQYNTEIRAGRIDEALCLESYLEMAFAESPENMVPLDSLKIGRYIDSIRTYASIFGEDRISILFVENIDGNEKSTMKSMCSNLLISDGIYEKYIFSRANRYTNQRSNILYQIAGLLNSRLEGFFQKYPSARIKAHAFFKMINEKKEVSYQNSRTSSTVIAKLNSYYAPFNRELSQYLASQPCGTAVPAKWST